MEIFKKIGITPTCRKETIERQEKLGDKIILEQKILRRKIVEAERSLKKQQDKNSEVAQDQEPTEEVPSNDGQTSPPQSPETEPTPQNGQTDEGQVPEALEEGSEQLPSELETRDLIFSDNVSYPSLRNVTPNKRDVRNLKALALGRGGELSTVLTYVYQFYILPESEQSLKAALKQAARTEMTHYEILNEAVVAFGGDPTPTDGQGNVWTGRNVNQEKNPRKILLDNIALEQGLIKQYLAAAREASNLSLAELYLKIIEEKQKNIELFQQVYNSL